MFSPKCNGFYTWALATPVVTSSHRCAQRAHQLSGKVAFVCEPWKLLSVCLSVCLYFHHSLGEVERRTSVKEEIERELET